MAEHVENALGAMAATLLAFGFSEIEVSEINLATRYAITSTIKERGRRLT